MNFANGILDKGEINFAALFDIIQAIFTAIKNFLFRNYRNKDSETYADE
jgi:hypothetical protein